MDNASIGLLHCSITLITLSCLFSFIILAWYRHHFFVFFHLDCYKYLYKIIYQSRVPKTHPSRREPSCLLGFFPACFFTFSSIRAKYNLWTLCCCSRFSNNVLFYINIQKCIVYNTNLWIIKHFSVIFTSYCWSCLFFLLVTTFHFHFHSSTFVL